jgi:hypothetical protein
VDFGGATLVVRLTRKRTEHARDDAIGGIHKNRKIATEPQRIKGPARSTVQKPQVKSPRQEKAVLSRLLLRRQAGKILAGSQSLSDRVVLGPMALENEFAACAKRLLSSCR